MKKMPTYDQLKRKTNQLEQEILEYIRKEDELKRKMKSAEYHHIRRTLLLIKINEELNKEIEDIKIADKEKIEFFSEKIKDRFKELRFLYSASSFRDETSSSVNEVLQEVVDMIPPAIDGTENICARIVLENSYEIRTKNFQETKCKQSQEIKLDDERFGQLEVCYFEIEPKKKYRLNEAKIIIRAFAENIAQIVERERLELEINCIRAKIEDIIQHK